MKIQLNKAIIGTMILTGLAFSACKKLDEEVFSEVISEEFTPTEQDLNAILAPVYTVMRPMFAGWYGNFDLQEESADHIVTPVRPNGWYDGGVYQRMHKHTWTPTQGQPNTLWGHCYNGINTANRVIYQIESGEVPVSEGKESVVAELKSARAFYYAYLLDNHANVPIVTDFKDTEVPKQSNRKELYDFVVSELEANIPLLNEKNDPTTYGRFNKWAAKSVLANVYLNAEIYVGTPQFDKVISLTDDIINSGLYSLEPNYRDVFKTDNQNSKELVFAVPYDEIYGTEFSIHMKTLDPLMQLVLGMQAQPWGGNAAVPQFIDTYDPDDHRLNDTWIQGPQYNLTTGEELINFVNFINSIEGSENNQGYRIGKYEIKNGAKGGLSNDFPVYRYASILFMKAEALLRKGDANGAAALVTQVRQRSFPTNPEKATVSGTDLLKGSSYRYGTWDNGVIKNEQGGGDVKFGRFLDELGWEFAAEGRRRADIIRFGVFTTKRWFNHDVSSPDKIIFPIPDAEINKNPNLKQNPGY